MSHGNKETKEMIVALMRISAELAKIFKDGLQATDAIQIFEVMQKDEELKKLLVLAYNDANLIDDEIKDLDFAEGVDLIAATIAEIPALYKAIKG